MSDRWLDWIGSKIGVRENDIAASFAARQGKPSTSGSWRNPEYYYFVNDNAIFKVDEQNPGWDNFKKLKEFSSEEAAVEEFTRMYFKMLSGDYFMTHLDIYGQSVNQDIDSYESPLPIDERVTQIVRGLDDFRDRRPELKEKEDKKFDFSKVTKLSKSEAKDLFEKVIDHSGGTLSILNLKGQSYRDLFEERAEELDSWLSDEYIYGVNDWSNRDRDGYYMIKRGS